MWLRLVSFVVLGCLVISSSVLAQTITITIQGEITETACTPQLTVNGISGNTITLPQVQLSALDVAGKTAGNTTITFALTGCGMSTAKNYMWAYFNSPGNTAGRINTSNANVKFEIRDVLTNGNMGDVVQVGGASGEQPSSTQGTAAPFTGSFPDRSASKSYIIRYYAQQPVNQAGNVTATATYTIKYY